MSKKIWEDYPRSDQFLCHSGVHRDMIALAVKAERERVLARVVALIGEFGQTPHDCLSILVEWAEGGSDG